MPAEHGSWAFLGEPVVLGLAVALRAPGATPSGGMAATLVAVATVAAFLARKPLRISVTDRREGRRTARTARAGLAAAALALAGAAAVTGAALLAQGPVLLAMGLAAPIGAVALAFDLDRRARDAAAEVTAALALAGAAPAIALAAGLPRPAAFALWAILAARAVPTVAYVRARLRLEKSHPVRTAEVLALHAAAAGGVALLAREGWVPWAAAVAMTVLALRAAVGLSPWRLRMTTMQLGLSEIAFGLLVVLATCV